MVIGALAQTVNAHAERFHCQRAVVVAALDVLAEIFAVVFGVALHDAFEYDALGTFGNALFCVIQPHTVLFQLVFVHRRIIAVAGETVGFPQNHRLEDTTLRIAQHSLKIRAFVGSAGESLVDVFSDDGKTVVFSVCMTFTQLPFNALLALAAGRIARINDGGYKVLLCAHNLLLSVGETCKQLV